MKKRGVWFNLKIHIVQKGDTLCEIAKQYQVDFEELKQINSHLSSPDMIMPGMKIKVPSSTKPVKKESHMNETKKPKEEQLYKDLSPKPMPVIQEDDKEKPKEIKPEMPKMPEMPQMTGMPKTPQQPQMMQMPMMEQEMNQYTTINIPESKPKVKEEAKEPKEKEKKEVKAPAYHQPINHHPLPGIPMCCHIIHPCYPPMPMGHHIMNHHGKGIGPPPHPMMMTPEMQPCTCGQKGNQTGHMMMPPHAKQWKEHAHEPWNPKYGHGFSPHHTAYPKPPNVENAYNENDSKKHPPFLGSDSAHYPYPHPSGYHPYAPFKRDKEERRDI